MITVHDIEGFRRSAALAPLPSHTTIEILEQFDRLVREREQIARVLADLPSSFGAVRAAVNELQTLIAG